MKKKYKRLKRVLCMIPVLLLFYIGAVTAPYAAHKELPESLREQFCPEALYGDSPGTEQVAYITDNQQALELRLAMIEQAQREIILSTFDFRSDNPGRDVMSALLHAAQRGVQVNILVDGVSGFLSLRGDPCFQALAANENIRIRTYNPVNLLKPWQLQARLHDKYLIIDEKMYLLGGRNTYDLFLGNESTIPNIDRELLVWQREEAEDSSLHQVQEYFHGVWEQPECRDYLCLEQNEEVLEARQGMEERYEELLSLYPATREPQDWKTLTRPASRVTLLSNCTQAANKPPKLWNDLTELMKTGEQVTIYTPYIICGREMYEDLTQVCRTVDRVEIITNDVASGANPWGCTDYLNQKEKIWATGAQVYEYLAPHSSHTKAMLVDDRLSVVGSYNMDMRSTYQNTELMLAVDCPELNAMIRAEAERDKTYSKTMQDGEYQLGENYVPVELSRGKKAFYWMLRVLIPPIRRFL